MRTGALAVLCVACGAAATTTAPDAPASLADAPAADAPPPPTGPLTVTVLDGSGGPVPLSSLLPTQIGGVVVDPTGSRLVVSWATAATGRQPAVALTEVAWKAVNGDGGVENRSWTVLAPPDPKTFSLPLLPPELAAFAPSLPADVGDYSATLTLEGDNGGTTYADFLGADWRAELDGTGPVHGAGYIAAWMTFSP